jgi:hydroxymethylglutaryl-CoA lyase
MPVELPAKATLIEVGPRDGFQFETRLIPTELKLGIIRRLAESGIRQIQVTSFVNPVKVPQMADAEELVRRLPPIDGVTYSGLTLNMRGLERAHAAGLQDVEISISASDTHSRKNTGMSHEQAREQGIRMIRLATDYHMHIRLGIQCAFGCVYEGRLASSKIMEIISDLHAVGDVAAVCLADTTGMANPRAVRALVPQVQALVDTVPLALHLHDTRGMGLANVYAALTCGVTYFDTSLGGIGGCPFVDGAAGNIATEDTVHMLEAIGVATGIDTGTVSRCSQQLAHFLDKPLPGKIYKLPVS